MRFYKLVIGAEINNGIIDNLSGDTFGNSSENPTPANIMFNIKAYDQTFGETLTMVRLYNITLEYFINTTQYIGKGLKLEAGFKTSPFTKKLGYEDVTQTLLYTGKIVNILPDFSSKTPFIDIYANSILEATNTENLQVTGSSVTIPLNENILEYIKKLMLQLNDSISVTYTDSLLNTTGQTILLEASSLQILANKVETQWGVTIRQKGNDSSIFELFLSDSSEVSTSAPKKLAYNDLISQPELLSEGAGAYSIETRLRADVKIGDYVTLDGLLPSLSNFSTIQNALTGFNANKVFKGGTFRIRSVNHTGEFYNSSPQAWSTQLELIPTEGNTLF